MMIKTIFLSFIISIIKLFILFNSIRMNCSRGGCKINIKDSLGLVSHTKKKKKELTGLIYISADT
jgi:uncharacterized membrane protein YobD (UPF0266 family)